MHAHRQSRTCFSRPSGVERVSGLWLVDFLSLFQTPSKGYKSKIDDVWQASIGVILWPN